MSVQDALSWIEGSNTIFAVEFRKRTTNELRMMNCRRKCESRLRGGPPAYDPAEKNLLVVFDMANKGYRCFDPDAMTRIKIDGEWHLISE